MSRRPRLAAWMLERWLPSEDRDEILGDLDEQFEATLDRRGFARRGDGTGARPSISCFATAGQGRQTHVREGIPSC